MSFLKPKFVLLALFGAALPLLSTSACGGDAFTGVASGGSSATGGSSGGGSLSTGSTNGQSCGGPEECDDKDPCTTDLCKADGTCATAPKCGGQQCCGDGTCAECCSAEDCNDNVECTENRCFMGQCMFVPDDSECAANEFCSSGNGCRPRQACGILAGEDTTTACADEDACTADSCGTDNFCHHDFCQTEAGALCCPGIGCAECCTDAQCGDPNDPCTVGSCVDGKCSTKPLCDAGHCCPSPDGKSAVCGACCSANDCDDKVPCTVDACGGGQCSHTPTCKETGTYCDLEKGTCIRADACKSASDCTGAACQTATCSDGVCQFTSCATGTKCCVSSNKCATCCSDSECSDNIDCTVDKCTSNGCTHTPDGNLCSTKICDGTLGCLECQKASDCDDSLPCTTDTCVGNKCSHASTCDATKPFCTKAGCFACTQDSDCQGGIILPPQQAAAIKGCENTRCVGGTCKTTYQMCDFGICCAPYGCMTNGCALPE